MISGVDHVAVRVADMERSLEFYRDLLGFEVVLDTRLDGEGMARATGAPGVRVRVVMLRKDVLGMIELVRVDHPAVSPFDGTRNVLDVGGACVISLNVDDIDGLVRELSARGVRFRSAPADIDVAQLGRTRIVFMDDPDGVVIELVESEGATLNDLNR